jgi:hypothetical protein
VDGCIWTTHTTGFSNTKTLIINKLIIKNKKLIQNEQNTVYKNYSDFVKQH